MTTATRTAAPTSVAGRYIQLAIEACWLAAIVTTVLTFNGRTFLFHFTQPKQYLLHLFALGIVSLWALEYAVAVRDRSKLPLSGVDWRFWRWAGSDPARWTLVFAGAFAVAQLLSAAFSPIPYISVFGRDPNAPGYELYTGLSYMVLFAAVALRVRNWEQVKRLILVVAVSGTAAAAYGTSQHFGWDPIGYGAGQGRVESSLGNPIFLASVLVMSLSATLAAFLLYRCRLRSWWSILTVLAIAVHVGTIWFSGSRGPLIAVVIAAAVLALVGVVLLDRRQLLEVSVIGVAGLVTGLVIIFLPSPDGTGGRSGRAIIGSILGQAAAATGSNVSLSGESLATDNVGHRADIWVGGLELLRTRESVEPGGNYITFVRHLFGYGQEMYYYQYTLNASTRPKFELVSHGHNYPLHIWLELGLLGIVSLVGLAVASTWTLLRLAWRVKRRQIGSASGLIPILLVGLTGIMVGRVIEQMPGVGRVGDLTMFWTVLGLVVAASYLAKPASEAEVDTPAPARSRATRRRSETDYRPLWIGAALGMAALALTLWITVDGVALYASRVAAAANHQLNLGNVQQGYDGMKRAANIDRTSEIYGLVAAQFERDTAEDEPDPDLRLRTMVVAYTTLAEYEVTNPWAVNNDVRLAAITGALAEMGVEGTPGELWDRTVDLDLRMRPYPRVMAFVANSYVSLGEFELGIEVADFSIEEAASVGIEVSQAWWAKGEALGRLDRTDEALTALETATEVDPDSQFAAAAHRTLADYYEKEGDTAEAQRHRGMAEEIEQALTAGT